MAKPTLLQSLLHKPSQSYAFPHQKQYYSNRNDMLSIASDPAQDASSSSLQHSVYAHPRAAPIPEPAHTPLDLGSSSGPHPGDIFCHPNHYRELDEQPDSQAFPPRPPSPSTSTSSSSSQSDLDVFYTPNQSPRTSMASTSFVVPQPPPQRVASRRSLRAMNAPGTSHPYNLDSTPHEKQPQPQIQQAVPSTRTPSRSNSLRSNNPTIATSKLNPNTTTMRATHTASVASSVSISSASLDGHSLFSDMGVGGDDSDEFTRVTTPLGSVTGLGDGIGESYGKREGKKKRDPYAYTDEDWAKDVRWLVPPRGDVAAAGKEPLRRQKDKMNGVASKATVTPSPGSGSAAKRKIQAFSEKHKEKEKDKPVYFTASHGTPLPPSSAIPGISKSMKMKKNMGHGGNASIMMSMSALWEEDEDPLGIDGPPRSSVLFESPPPRTYSAPNVRMHVHPRSLSSSTSSMTGTLPRVPGSSGSSSSNAGGGPKGIMIRPGMRRRRSRSLEHHSRPLSVTSLSSTRYTSCASEVNALPRAEGELPSMGTAGYTSLVLPRAPPSSGTAKGIVAVGGKEGKVDLTKSGVAQTTMASVEVVRGLAGGKRMGGGIMGVFGKKERARSRSVGAGGGVSGDGAGSSMLGFTSYRKPPTYVPSGSVLVQVWAVGVDCVDGRLAGVRFGSGVSPTPTATPERSTTLRSKFGRSVSTGSWNSNTTAGVKKEKEKEYQRPQAEVGYIPGRSFVGRVLECGWEVGENVVRKGEWVIGLLDVRKAGALTEFIVVDRHRIHRVPHPILEPSAVFPDGTDRPPAPARRPSESSNFSSTHPSLSLEELALLPLCGVPAYRAVRTFTFAFSSIRDNAAGAGARGGFDLASEGNGKPQNRHPLVDHENGVRRRALVLRGQDGPGAIAVQILVARGWRVCVHVPFLVPASAPPEAGDRYMADVEERVRLWGAEEVIFDDGELDGDDGRGAAVRVMDGLRSDGDVFDAVLDTVGGKAVREAAEKLLRSSGSLDSMPGTPGTDGRSKTPSNKSGKGGMGQFTTLFGDTPERPIPTAGDHFRAGLRSLRYGSSDGITKSEEGGKANGKVGYAWVSIDQDVDWEGEDVNESIAAVLRLALDSGVRPWAEANHDTLGDWDRERMVPFEKAPELFLESGPLRHGGTAVIKIAG